MTESNVAEWLEQNVGANHAMSITHVQIGGAHKWIISTTVSGRVVRGESVTASDAVAQFDRDIKNLRR